MKVSKKNQLKVTGLIAVLLLAGVIFFFPFLMVLKLRWWEAGITKESR